MSDRLLRGAPVAAVLLLLLALVALASRAGHGRSSLPSVPAPPAATLDYGLTVAIAAAAAACLLVLGRLRLPQPKQVRSTWHLLWTFVLVGASVTLGVLIARGLHVVHHPGAGAGAGGGAQHLSQPKGAGRERPVEFRWTAGAIVFGVLAASGAAWYALRRRRLAPGPAPTEPTMPGALADALDESLDDLRREPDARRAVIAAYARAERALERHGLPRRPAEAPLEYLSRVLLELRVRAAAVLELTDLFERAKFGPHRVDESMREEAIAALVAVRDDLAGAAA